MQASPGESPYNPYNPPLRVVRVEEVSMKPTNDCNLKQSNAMGQYRFDVERD